MRRRGAPVSSILLVLLAVACAHRPGGERSKRDASADPEMVALLAQLRAEPAAAAACSVPGGAGLGDPARAAALVGALERDEVVPRAWAACLRELERRGDAPADAILRALAPAYLRLLGDGEVERVERRREQLQAAHRALWDRPAEWTLPPAVKEELDAGLRALAAPGPVGRTAIDEARAALEMEAGRYQNGAVAIDTVKMLENAGAEPALLRLAVRLPDPAPRSEAKKSVLRLRLAASGQPALRADPEAVAEKVLAQGANPLPLEGRKIASVEVDRAALPFETIVVRQDPASQRGSLLSAPARLGEGPGSGRAGETDVWPLLPIPLRAVVKVRVDGLTEAITVCGDAGELDPTPCIAPDRLAVVGGPARYDPARRALVLNPELSLAELAAVASAGLAIQLRVAGEAVAVTWPLRFQRPAELSFSAARGNGPDLTVEARVGAGGPLVVRARPAGGAERLAIVERDDLGAFRIVSRGAAGEPGAGGRDGIDGENGEDGNDINCTISRGLPMPGTPGRNGGDGHPGHPGARGGNGGAIQVRLSCPAPECAALETALRAAVRSEPGPGGPGGGGGKPGLGGRGGQFGRCTDRASIFQSAADGKPGTAGARGAEGARGNAGAVVVDVDVTPGG